MNIPSRRGFNAMVKKGFLSILASTAICLTVALSCGSEERNRTTRKKTPGEKNSLRKWVA
jgi:hypothetical protein